MKTVAYPREKRTEFVSDAGANAWAITDLVRAAIAQAKDQLLISYAERQDEQGQTCMVVIARPLPRVGQAVKLTVGESVAGIFPAGGSAEKLIADIKHSADCPRAQEERADCICAANLTLRERDTGH